MFAFEVYEATDNGVEVVESIAIDPKNKTEAVVQAELNEILKLKGKKRVYVSPLNVESAAELMKPKTRGRKVELSPEVVRLIHEKYVTERLPLKKVPFEIFSKFDGLIVSDNIVKAVVDQERDVEVDGIDELRTKALELKGNRKTRRKHTDEVKKEWVRLHLDEGLTGSEIGEKFETNSATVNAHLKDEGVQQYYRTASTVNGRRGPKLVPEPLQ